MTAALLGIVAALAWGTHDLAARFASRAIGHHFATLGVTAAGALWLGAWAWHTGLELRVEPAHVWLLAASGGGIALATLWLFAALSAGPVSLAAPIVGAYPVFAVLLAFVMGTRPGIGQWVAMSVVVLGVAVTARFAATGETADAARAAAPRSRVIGFALASSVFFALAITAGQQAAARYGDVQATLLARLFGLAVIAAVVLRRKERVRATRRWWPVLAVMGALDAVALAAVLGAGGRPHAELATVTSSAFGAVTVLLARVVLRERISRLQWLGIWLVFCGVAALSYLR